MRSLRGSRPADGAAHEPVGVPPVPRDLGGLFVAPRWLADLGRTSWLIVGVTLATAALVTVLALTRTIVMPVIAASVVAAVTSPIVAWLQRHGVRRGIGAILVLLGLVAFVIATIAVVLGGITGQLDSIGGVLDDAKDQIGGWAQDVGIADATVDGAKDDASDAVNSALPALLQGVGGVLKGLSSLAFFLSLTALSLIFLHA